MDWRDYRNKRHQDPEYKAAKEELKPYINLANNVFELRLRYGWSQEELADRVGTKQANISKIESGLSNPTLKIIHKIAKAFDVEVVDLLGDVCFVSSIVSKSTRQAVEDSTVESVHSIRPAVDKKEFELSANNDPEASTAKTEMVKL
ncbi:MAG: XRE family transcriptional regulator [Chloroflexota bacterium]|nr:MAG: XRE family transcriptional regulator [Chloroflexota bacterium]